MRRVRPDILTGYDLVRVWDKRDALYAGRRRPGLSKEERAAIVAYRRMELRVAIDPGTNYATVVLVDRELRDAQAQ